jgi:hypothetical protein
MCYEGDYDNDKPAQDASKNLADLTLKLVIKRLNDERRADTGWKKNPILSIFKWGKDK